MPRKIDDSVIINLVRELDSAKWGESEGIYARFSKTTGYAMVTLKRAVSELKGQKRSRKSGNMRISQDLIDKIANLKIQGMQMGVEARELPTEVCIDILEKQGLVEPGTLKVSTVNERLEKSGFRAKQSYNLIEISEVNAVHHVDFSRSEYFEVYEILKDGDVMLKCDGRNKVGSQKNKVDDKVVRLWICACVESSSRIAVHRYYASSGENAEMVADFFDFVYGRNEDGNRLRSLPREFQFDQGSTGKNSVFKNTIQNAGIAIQLNTSKSDRIVKAQSGGKVENKFKNLWKRFELSTAIILINSGKKYVKLSELNEMVHQFNIAQQNEKHPRFDLTRLNHYERGIMTYPERFLQTSFRTILIQSYETRVRADRKITLKTPSGRTDFKIPEMIGVGKEIQAFIDVYGNAIVRDMQTQHVYEMEVYQYLDNRQFKSSKSGYNQTISKQAPVITDKVEISNPAPVSGKKSNILTFKQTPENVTVDTPFNAIRNPDYFSSAEDAKVYIGKKIGQPFDDLDSDIKAGFNAFLAETLSKKAIDILLAV